MIKNVIAGLGAVGFMAACASTGGNDEAREYRVVNENDEVTHICRNERAVGSHFPQRVCRDVRNADTDRDRSQDDLDRMRRGALSGENN